ncbi:uncharacterized protein LOC125022067 [Mugil cephalus]|uniref:uncharacterized protein LOC125022067 n=1 Tax=Mugil cephalus TaxID=48193 RepID=UPI001FB70977|nr:uncharacterized protein LOC125022067 [Mugil cephalus]
MKGGLPLRLLAVFTLVARCQQKPQVTLSTKLNQIFIGDLIYLKCDNITKGDEKNVKWYLNGQALTQTGQFLKIPVDSGSEVGPYRCEDGVEKSDPFTRPVSDLTPSASLTIHSGQPVMPRGGSVNLKIEHEDGLVGWLCWTYRGNKLYKVILRKMEKDAVSYIFEPQTKSLPETIVWCSDKTTEVRSNQIILRNSDKEVLLEMNPFPPIVGESLTLACMVWGTDRISHAVFYKNNASIHSGDKSTYEIPHVTDSTKREYKCEAVFTYRDTTGGPPRTETSESQEVFVQGRPKRAALTEDRSCSCSSCPDGASYRYYKKDGQSWVLLSANQQPTVGGTYRCRAVWGNKRSFPSNALDLPDSGPPLIIIVLVVIVLLVVGATIIYFVMKKKRNQATGAIYEDVGQKARDKDEDKYQELQVGRGRDAEYDTLKLEEMGGEKKEGEYEALKKDGTKEGVYHTLGQAAAAGGDGGYEALKKGGTKEDVYHSLGQEGATGGEGGYEALKKGGVKDDVYHSLGKEGAAEGDGGYEALKKEGTKEGVYHTLGKEGAAGGDEKA